MMAALLACKTWKGEHSDETDTPGFLFEKRCNAVDYLERQRATKPKPVTEHRAQSTEQKPSRAKPKPSARRQTEAPVLSLVLSAL